MKAFLFVLSIATVAVTFTAVHANAADVNCKDIVQGGDPKAVSCQDLSGSAKEDCLKKAPAKTPGKTDVSS
ncbi:MAG: hypothetical protein HY075_07715 [Deltaproteobacteria bacterium]|nr:hypothetical protein [Deltaproteobacteria bacterium]